MKPAWLLLENVVQDEIGHESYGIFAALYALGFLFISFSDLGINMYTTKKVAGDPEKLREIFSQVISLKILMSLIYPAFMVLVGYLLGYNKLEIYFLALLCFTQALLQILLFFRSNFQANQYFRLDSIVSVSDKAVLMIIILFMMLNRLTLESYIYSRLISAVITIFIFYAVLIKLYGFIKPSFNFEKIREILLFSLPFAIMTILYSINEKIDQVMLERLGSQDIGQLRAGLYAGAYRWLEAFQMYLWTVLPFFFAKFAFHQKDQGKLQQYFNMGQVLTALPMIFISVFVFFYSEKLFWLYDNSSGEQIEIMANTCKILFLSAFLNGFFAVYGSLLSCIGLEKKISWIVVVSTVLNIVLNYFFIPLYGTYAAAFTTFISVLFLSVSYLFMIRAHRLIVIPAPIVFRLLILSAMVFGSFAILKQLGLAWHTVTGVSFALTLLFAWMLRLNRLVKWD